MPLAPIRKGGSVSCLVYHDLPVLDDFRHESTRKCAETTRRRKSSRTHPQKAENRPACGYRTVFCLYRKIWEWRAFRVHLCPCIIPPAAEKVECFCTKSPIMAQNAFYRAASRRKTPANAKRDCCTALCSSPFLRWLAFCAAMPPGKRHFEPLLGISCKSTPLFLPPVV